MKGKGKGKRSVASPEISESSESEDEQEADVVYMDESLNESVMVAMVREMMMNACAECRGEEGDDWIGCDHCARWYHKGCLNEQHEAIKTLV